MSIFQYPLHLRFKKIALAPRIYLTDANGTERLFIHQKTWALKEDIRLYNNSKKEQEIFSIRANRIIDFSAHYHFFNSTNEQSIGSVKRKGMRSLWRATYFSDNASGQTTHHIKENNPWTKMADAILLEIPLVSLLSGYFFNPSYTVYGGENREDESSPVMKLVKKPSFWESGFDIELLDPNIGNEDEIRLILAIIMAVQLERRRG